MISSNFEMKGGKRAREKKGRGTKKSTLIIKIKGKNGKFKRVLHRLREVESLKGNKAREKATQRKRDRNVKEISYNYTKIFMLKREHARKKQKI